MINKNNYTTEISKLDISKAPEALQKGHTFYQKASGMEQFAKVNTLYLEKLNAWAKTQQPAQPAPAPPTATKKTVHTKNKKPIDKPGEKAVKSDNKRPTKADMKALKEKAVSDAKKALEGGMTTEQVLVVARSFQKMRGMYGAIDKNIAHKRILAPTKNNLIRWMMQPGHYDMMGVDIKGDVEPNTIARDIRKTKIWNLLGRR
jgi:hypothetical protein